MTFGRTKGGSVVTENPKGEIAENFGRIQMGDHSNLTLAGGRGDRESHQIRGITSVKLHLKGGLAKFHPV